MRTGRLVSNARLVGEACYRRLSTPRGTLRGGEDEANYGLDLSELVGQAATPGLLASLPALIKNELEKDERVLDVEVDVQSVASGPSTVYLIDISVETSEGPFRLQLQVSDVTVELLGLAEAA
jgi:phage baseplate assembly protein W